MHVKRRANRARRLASRDDRDGTFRGPCSCFTIRQSAVKVTQMRTSRKLLSDQGSVALVRGACTTAPLALLLASASIWAATPIDPGGSYAERCRAAGVVLCVPLDSEARIAPLRSVPGHLDAESRIQYDPSKQAARFTIPSRTSSDSSGFVQVRFPKPLMDVYVSFDVF